MSPKMSSKHQKNLPLGIVPQNRVAPSAELNTGSRCVMGKGRQRALDNGLATRTVAKGNFCPTKHQGETISTSAGSTGHYLSLVIPPDCLGHLENHSSRGEKVTTTMSPVSCQQQIVMFESSGIVEPRLPAMWSPGYK
ncbi:hypothetical protein ATANTOWER_025580 [Ataeniobius toweri]|uniref:Uncharacterized protein n=1 Tax=Ataeniobius toweri TaxID=208326 RepID=A0ABU7BJL5_9TELE|nr:hypothetical protein [Ataeniobius toweri]